MHTASKMNDRLTSCCIILFAIKKTEHIEPQQQMLNHIFFFIFNKILHSLFSNSKFDSYIAAYFTNVQYIMLKYYFERF